MFPAPAGMSPFVCGAEIFFTHVPRTRGDEPVTGPRSARLQ